MAKTKAGLLSLGASGKIAGTLIASRWKSRNYTKAYTVPTNPQTTEQTTSRDAVASAVLAWRTTIAQYPSAADWSTIPKHDRQHMSGYNFFISSFKAVQPFCANPSFAVAAVAVPGHAITWTLRNVLDNSPATEPNLFHWQQGWPPQDNNPAWYQYLQYSQLSTPALFATPTQDYFYLTGTPGLRFPPVKLTLVSQSFVNLVVAGGQDPATRGAYTIDAPPHAGLNAWTHSATFHIYHVPTLGYWLSPLPSPTPWYYKPTYTNNPIGSWTPYPPRTVALTVTQP